MNTLPQTIKDYLEELETLDVRPVKYYYDVISWDLEHYDQGTGEYEKKIEKLFREAYNDAAMMDNEHKGRLLSRLQEIEAKYTKFWKFWIEHNNAYENGSFDAHQFEWDLPCFFKSDFKIEAGEFTPQLYVTPDFFMRLSDAAMFKSGTLTKFIKDLTPAPIAAPVNEKAKTGRKKDPEIQKRNLDMCNDYVKYIKAEHFSEKDALERVYKSYKKNFTGDPKNIQDQIRRIIRATQSDMNQKI